MKNIKKVKVPKDYFKELEATIKVDWFCTKCFERKFIGSFNPKRKKK